MGNPVTSRAVTVIGAGIVGACTAAWLQRKGFSVTIFDRDEPGRGASFGNAGVLAPGAFLPVAMPGMLRQVPRWLTDPLGPLTIRWKHLPSLSPWLFRFLRQANATKMLHSAEAMATLVGPAWAYYEPLLNAAGARDLVRDGGSLFVHASEEEKRADEPSARLRSSLGLDYSEVSEEEIRALSPDLAPQFRWGHIARDNRRITNPNRLVSMLVRHVTQNGGSFIKTDVRGVSRRGDQIFIQTADGERASSAVVVCTGAWSGGLMRGLGDSVPLESQRGYHVCFADSGVSTHCTVSWVKRRVFVNPMEAGLRIAGTVELAGLAASPNWRRADALAQTAKTMFPKLNEAQRSNWMGHRPCFPDSLPVIGRSRSHSGIFYAVGHQHVGMSSASTTGYLIAQILAGEQPDIDLSPFSIERFARG